MPINSNIDSSQRAGVLADLADTWRKRQPTFEKQWGMMMKMLGYTKIRHAEYAFKDALPIPKFWGYGAGRTRQTIRDHYITVSIYKYEISLPWSIDDEDSDLLGDMATHINSAVGKFLLLPIKFAAEYMEATASLLPSLANAYDGAALYSATDGAGANRLGVSGGNILTGHGLTSAGVMADFTAAQRFYLSEQDTAGQPIFDESMCGYDKMVAVIPPSLNELFQRVSGQEMIRSDALNNTSESNFLKSTFRYEICPFLTDTSDWFIFLDAPDDDRKAFAYRSPQNENDMQTVIADMMNSDDSREFAQKTLHSHIKCGLTPYFPGCTVKINH